MAGDIWIAMKNRTTYGSFSEKIPDLFHPGDDEPNEASSIHSDDNSSPNAGSIFGDSVAVLNLPTLSEIPDDKQVNAWKMNYHEAAIYLQVSHYKFGLQLILRMTGRI